MNRWTISLVGWTLGSSLVVGAALGGDWTQFRGPQGSGTVQEGLPDGEGVVGLRSGWVRDLGSGYSGVVTDGKILVTQFAAGEQDVVGAFDAASGDELWRFEIEPTYTGHDGSHSGPIATPLIAGDRVFASGAWGRFVALDLVTGKLAWSVHFVDDLGAEKPWYGFGCSPIAVGDDVVVGVGADAERGTLVSFDRGSGDISWRTGTDTIEYQSLNHLKLAGREQIVAGAESTVFSVDPASGEILWTFEHKGRGGRGAASLTVLPVGNDRIFIDHDDNQSALLEITSVEGTLSATKVWEGRALIGSYIPPIEVGGALYGYTTRFLSGVDVASGDELFKSREPGDGFPVAIGDQLVVLTKAGSLHVGPASPTGWQETGSLDLFEKHSWTPPAFADGSLYLRSFSQLARVDLVREPSVVGRAKGMMPARIATILAAEDRNKAIDEALAASPPPWVDGNRVTFVWRGEAKDVGIGGDMIGIRDESPMQRVEGTDLWWYSTEVPPGARFNYAFLIDFEPALDPYNSRSVQSTQYGPDMNIARPDAIVMSWMGMPGWQEPTHYQDLPAGQAHGDLHEHVASYQPPVEESDEGDEADGEEGAEAAEPAPPIDVKIAVWTPPGYEDSGETYPILYVLDGDAYRLGGWTNTLDRLVGDSIQPLVVAFVDFPRAPGPLRQAAFQESVVPWVESEFRVLAERTGRALFGAGDSSFDAVMTAFSHPDFAGRLGIQSVSAIDFQLNMMREAMGENTAAAMPLEIYYEWGILDQRADAEGWDMRDSAKQIQEALTSRGYRPVGGEVADSSDWASWRNRTDRVLETLFANPATASEDAVAE